MRAVPVRVFRELCLLLENDFDAVLIFSEIRIYHVQNRVLVLSKLLCFELDNVVLSFKLLQLLTMDLVN